MISGTGDVRLSFEEPDLTSAVPQSALFVAVAIAHGWQLSRDGGENLEDCYIGPKHLQDFKTCQRRQIRRVITYRFAAVKRTVFGENITLNEFLRRCQQDSRYFIHAQAHPKATRKLELLLEHFAKSATSILVSDPESHDRRLVVPVHGGPLDLIHQLAQEYEMGLS